MNEQEIERLKEEGNAVHFVPLSAPVDEYLAAAAKDKLYFKNWRRKAGLAPKPKIESNDAVNSLVTIAEELREHIWEVEDRINSVVDEALSKASIQEARAILRQIYWSYILSAIGEDWSAIDYEMLAPYRSKNRDNSLLPRSEEEWQEKAGPLEYQAVCEVCQTEFPRIFTSMKQYERECDEIGSSQGLVMDVCPRCKPKLRKTAGYVYLLQSPTQFYKIGKTNNPKNRVKTFGVKLPFEVQYLCLIPTYNMTQLEQSLHERFRHKRGNGEWFRLDEDDIAHLKKLEIGIHFGSFLEAK